MSGADHTHDARFDQEKLSGYLPLLHGLLAAASELLDKYFPPPPIRKDELYTRDEVIRRTRCSRDTYTLWVKAGVPLTPDNGKSGDLIWGADLVDFLRDKSLPGKILRIKKIKG